LRRVFESLFSAVRQAAPGWVLFALFLALYGYHAAPDVTWGDSGEFASVVRTLGIAHPTGYPLYTLTGKALVTLCPLGTPARVLNLFSAFCSAAALGVLYGVIRLVLEELESSSPLARSPFVRSLAAVFATVLLGLSPMFLSQALITEVYALSSLLQVLAWYCLLRWWRGEWSPRWFCFTLGLALAHHLTILVLAPFFLLLILIGLRLRGRCQKELAVSLLFLVPPLSLYLYLPIRAASGPVINWGDPSTLDNLGWMLKGADFQDSFNLEPLFQPYRWEFLKYLLALHGGRLAEQFHLFLPFLAASGAALVDLFRGGLQRRSGALLLLLLWLAQGFSAFYLSFYFVGDRDVFFLLTYPVTVMLIAVGFWFVLATLRAEASRLLARWGLRSGRDAGTVLGVVLLAFAGFHVLHRGWLTVERDSARRDNGASRYGETLVQALPPGSVLLVSLDKIPADNAIYPLWYQKWGLGRGEGVEIVGANFFKSSWYRSQLSERVWFPTEADIRRVEIQPGQSRRRASFQHRQEWVAVVLEFLKRNRDKNVLYTTFIIDEMRADYAVELVTVAPAAPGSVWPEYRRFLPNGRLYRLTPKQKAALPSAGGIAP